MAVQVLILAALLLTLGTRSSRAQWRGEVPAPAPALNSMVENFEYLFYRPAEPVFLPKGNGRGQRVVFEIPHEFLRQRYRGLDESQINQWRESPGVNERIAVQNLSSPIPDVDEPAQRLARRTSLSLFIPEHRRLANKLISIFMAQPSVEELLAAAVYAKSNVNPYLFVYAFSVALLHRKDTRGARIPLAAEIFPDKFVDGSVFARAREEAGTVLDAKQRIPLEIPMDYTASDLDEEHRVAYFREDLGINLHHWHWHLYYPHSAPIEVVKKDRRGELFYYLHQQITARYNFERLSNRLQRVKRFLNFREPIVEGYFPKLTNLVASRVWPPRVANTVLSDINRVADNLQFDLQDLERWRDRIYDAIHFGAVVTTDGQRLNLTEFGGIDTLGNMVEASDLSPNPALYGDLHNFGHLAVSLSHDPDHRHLESFGVMGDTTTAMRDPFFYRWHAFINDLFMEHKDLLTPYTEDQLRFAGVRVKSVEVQSKGLKRKNVLNTFWQQNDLDLSRGLDFAPGGPLYARFTHLQHREFTYNIEIENESSGVKEGYVRIFLAPRFDERGAPMQLREQRSLMIELDKFRVNLRSRNNEIVRRSTLSSVTIPFNQTFRHVESEPGNDPDNFCGCGWPQHMLIPKGTVEGLPCQLFVMVTDYSRDKVQDESGKAQQRQTVEKASCPGAHTMCGVLGGKYPDKRPMGFPFDRRPRAGVGSLRTFLTPNMLVQDVVVRFTDRVEAPAARNTSIPIST